MYVFGADILEEKPHHAAPTTAEIKNLAVFVNRLRVAGIVFYEPIKMEGLPESMFSSRTHITSLQVLWREFGQGHAIQDGHLEACDDCLQPSVLGKTTEHITWSKIRHLFRLRLLNHLSHCTSWNFLCIAWPR